MATCCPRTACGRQAVAGVPTKQGLVGALSTKFIAARNAQPATTTTRAARTAEGVVRCCAEMGNHMARGVPLATWLRIPQRPEQELLEAVEAATPGT
mmetsp:Transcript_116891/g.377228  ORF Transcript_116891/g.377228 Transcript_116891/m.377228 type:complete len:97 (+) Transcript_116891:659-949(+)